MNRILTILVLLGLAGGWPSFAQNQNPAELEGIPVPKPPFVLPMPENAMWVITFKGASEKPDASEPEVEGDYNLTARTITVKKWGDLKQEVVVFKDGKSLEAWSKHDLRISNDVNSKNLLRTFEDPRSDFPLVSWINAANYLGVQEFAGEACYVFETKEPTMELFPGRFSVDLLANFKPMSGPSQELVKQAFISMANKRPLGAKIGKRTATYSYAETPSPAAVIPPKFQEEFDKWAEDLALSNRPMPAP